jgi:hypothetical protein
MMAEDARHCVQHALPLAASPWPPCYFQSHKTSTESPLRGPAAVLKIWLSTLEKRQESCPQPLYFWFRILLAGPIMGQQTNRRLLAHSPAINQTKKGAT